MKRVRKSRDDPIIPQRSGRRLTRNGRAPTAPDLFRDAGGLGRESCGSTNRSRRRHDRAAGGERSLATPTDLRKKTSRRRIMDSQKIVDSEKLPERIARRPNPSQWALDELLTLEEAAALHWPEGLLTARSLRTAAEAGALSTVIIARKRLTTRRQIAEMSRCERIAPASRAQSTNEPRSRIGMTLQEARSSAAGCLPPEKRS